MGLLGYYPYILRLLALPVSYILWRVTYYCRYRKEGEVNPLMSWMLERIAWESAEVLYQQVDVPGISRPVDLHSRMGNIGRIGKEWNPEILNMGIIKCLVYSSVCGVSEIPL